MGMSLRAARYYSNEIFKFLIKSLGERDTRPTANHLNLRLYFRRVLRFSYLFNNINFFVPLNLIFNKNTDQ